MMDPREVLEKLCLERGEDYARLSRLLGRNDAYVQQFIKRGTPKRLHEEDRRKLADYFAISEALLGGPPDEPGADGLVSVNRHPVSVSAGPGAVPAHEVGRPYFAFDERWLRRLTATPAARLSIVRVQGDSMAPTLNEGDDILIDPADCEDRIRDGIYVIRVDDTLVVKRLALNPKGRRVTVQSDNPAYADWPDCRLEDIHCIGRVIWSGRKVA